MPRKPRRLVLATLALATWTNFAPAQAPEPARDNPAPQEPVVIESMELAPAAAAPEVQAWGGIERLTGPGVGYRESFTTLEGFVPVYRSDFGVLFGDLRGILSDTQLVSGNLGAGYRYLAPGADRIWGANLFWDVRDAGDHTFHQVGFGFESLGQAFDVRSNVYLVAGADQKATGVVFADPTFVGHNILLQRFGYSQAAMSGFDAEVGAPLSCRLGLKAYVGAYNYQVSDSPQAWGVRARLEERLTDGVNLDLSYSNDRVFGNSVVFAAGLRFGGRDARRGSSRCDVPARLADRVERNYQIAVTDQVVRSSELALDPTTRQPIVVEHVASYAAAGGDGTVEHPFNTLAALQAGSAPGQILFAWANSTFTNQSIALQANQRFLGEGPACPPSFTALQGTFLLPRATAGTLQPVITFGGGAPSVNAVTLANNTEVSGFVINQAPVNAIFGDGVTGFYVHCNTINNPGANGVFVDNLAGAGTIDANAVNFTYASVGVPATQLSNGVFLRGSSFTGAVTNNTIAYKLRNLGYTQANSLNGVLAQTTTYAGSLSGNATTYQVTSASVTGARSLNGVAVQGDVAGTVGNNTASYSYTNAGISSSNGSNGVFVSGAVAGSVTGNQASYTVQSGSIGGGSAANGVFISRLTSGSISNNAATYSLHFASINGGFGGNGVFVNGLTTGNVTGNTFALTINSGSVNGGFGGNGVFLDGNAVGNVSGNTASIKLQNASINDDFGGNGVFVDGALTGSANSNTVRFTLNNASIKEFGGNGVFVDGATSGSLAGNTVTYQMTNASMDNGFVGNGVFADGSVGGGVSGNSVSYGGQFFSFNGGSAGNGLLLDGTVSGNITGNTINNTGSSFTVSGGNAGNGILLIASSLDTSLTGNSASGNASAGMNLQLTPPSGSAKAFVSGNTFANNNGTSPDFLADNGSGSGAVGIILDNNKDNSSPAKTVSYQFTSSGAGTFTVQDNGNNTGTVNLAPPVTSGPVTFP